MRGVHEVVVQNNRVQYKFAIRRNLTILRGDSATGVQPSQCDVSCWHLLSISIIMDGTAGNKRKDTGVWNLSPESWNTPPGTFLVFRTLFRRRKPWYTENDNPEFEEIES